MKSVVAWFARNPVAANLLMWIVLIGGALSAVSIPQKEMPDIQIDVVTVSVEYRGAAPEEVEEGVCVRVEEELDGVEGIEKIRSTSNGIQGLLLVVGILMLFLRARVALWVSMGVPVAILGALFLMPLFGYSINSISTFGFIMVLGMLVDDAIVVGENVNTYQQQGQNWLQAAIRGTSEVTVPVIFGVLTTVAAFSPLLLVPGTMGQIMSVIGCSPTTRA